MNQHLEFSSHVSSRRGSALLTVVVVLITLSALAVSMTNLTVMGVREQVKRYDKVSLMVSAESAVNVAMAHLQRHYEDLITTDLTANEADGGAESDYTYQVDLAAYDLSNLNGVALEATVIRLNDENPTDPDLIYFKVLGTATVGDPSDPMTYRRTRVETTLMPAPQNVFKQAIFALEGYNFMGSAKTDSWNSDSSVPGGGPYGATTTGAEGDLASEGDIDVLNPSNVGGDIIDNQEMPLPVFVYADEVGSLAGSGTLNDAYVKTNGSLVSGATYSYTLNAGSSYRFSSLDLSSKSHLILRGSGEIKLFIDGSVNFRTAELIYADSPATTLKVYQGPSGSASESSWNISTGVLGDANSGGVVGANFPSHLLVLSEHGGSTTMNGNGTFCGIFFAPNSTIKFNGTFDFFGSVVAQRYDTKPAAGSDEQGKINGTFSFHYDESLTDLKLDLTARLVMLGWRSFNLGYNFSE